MIQGGDDLGWSFSEDRSIYSQVCERITEKIIGGEWHAGERIPSVRELAMEAGVNPNTMQKAMSELERIGIIETHGTIGRSVTVDEELIKEVRRGRAAESAAEFAMYMKNLGLQRSDVLSILENVWSRGGNKYE